MATTLLSFYMGRGAYTVNIQEPHTETSLTHVAITTARVVCNTIQRHENVRDKRFDLPTPESPIKTILKRWSYLWRSVCDVASSSVYKRFTV